MAKRFAMASGRLIDIENFTEDDINLEDIAHHLAKVQRFNGSSPIDASYSVGEHSINLCRTFVAFTNKRQAILHDASEAYLSDIVSPVKATLKDYLRLENKIQCLILKKYGILEITDFVAERDKRILIDEVEHIMPTMVPLYEKETGLAKLGCHIEYNNHPATIKRVFLNICKNLGIKD